MPHASAPAPGKRRLAAFRALCASGWPVETLVPALLEALHGLVPSDRNLFDFTDEHGRLLRWFVEGPVDAAVARHYFECFHNRAEPPGMPPFDSLRHARAGVRSAQPLCTAAFFGSALYHEIWKPQGLHTRIEGVLRDARGRLLGSLVLYRGPGERVFDAADERLLAALLPPIAAAIAAAPAVAVGSAAACAGVAASGTGSVPAVAGPATASGLHTARLHTARLHTAHVARRAAATLVFDLAGRLAFASSDAAGVLMLADGGVSPESVRRPVQALAHARFGHLLEQARQRVARGRDASPLPWPSASLVNGWGRFDARVLPLDGVAPERARAAPGRVDTLLQLTVQPFEAREVALRRVVRRLPLSVGQAEVCLALQGGSAQRDIARALGVSGSTVADHARKIYRALEVDSAPALRALLERLLAVPAG